MNYSSYIDHSVLHPQATNADILYACNLAQKYKVAALCVQPSYIAFAYKLLQQNPVAIATVIGFPHGATTTESKIHDSLQAIELGAKEIDAVINIAEVCNNNMAYIQAEIRQLSQLCKQHKATLKIIFETTYISQSHIPILCKICSNEGVDFVKTSTGFDFIRNKDGAYSTVGARISDIEKMRKYAASHVKIKASGGIRTAEYFKQCIQAGADRIGTSATEVILKDC